MKRNNLQFQKDVFDIVKHHLNEKHDLDEHIYKYVHSIEYFRFSIDALLKTMNFFLKEHSDFLVLSLVNPKAAEPDAIELYSSYHVDVNNIDNLKSALNNHLDYIKEEKFEIIVHHYLFYHDKKDNRIFLKPSNATKYYPIYYSKIAA